MTRNEALAKTADLRAKLADVAVELAEINSEMDEGRASYSRLVRLTDRRHDLTARRAMICRLIDARLGIEGTPA